MDEYNARQPPFQLTKDALSSKWTKLNFDCNKYNDIVSPLKQNRRSRTDNTDFQTWCDAQFNTENMRTFNSYPAWEFLQDKQKWQTPHPVVVGRRNKRRETINVDDIDDEQDLAPREDNAALFRPSSTPRPAGKSRKSHKSTSTSTASSSTKESFEDTCERVASINDQRKDYYKAKKLAAFIKILRTKTDDLDPFDREMVEEQKREIRAQMAAERIGTGGSGSGAGGSGSGVGGSGPGAADTCSSTDDED